MFKSKLLVGSALALALSVAPALAHTPDGQNGPISVYSWLEVTAYAQIASPANGSVVQQGNNPIFSTSAGHRFVLKNTGQVSHSVDHRWTMRIKHITGPGELDFELMVQDSVGTDVSVSLNSNQSYTYYCDTLSNSSYNPGVGTHTAEADTLVIVGTDSVATSHQHTWTKQ